MDITALGEILIDYIPDGIDADDDCRFIRKAGGAPLNLLAAAARGGCKTAFIGKVGKDMFGDFLRDTLTQNGICADGLVTDPVHNTTLAFVQLDKTGDRSFSFYRRRNADIFLSDSEVPDALIRSSKIFHYGSLSFTDEPSRAAAFHAIKTAKSAGCLCSYDPNDRPMLWDDPQKEVYYIRKGAETADICKLSKEEAAIVTGGSTDAQTVRKMTGASIVLVTDGARDVEIALRDETAVLPVLQVKAVDTTGAGDIFFGTFLSRFIRSGKTLDALTIEDIKAFTRTAIRIAGLSTLRHGAIASIPDKAEYESEE